MAHGVAARSERSLERLAAGVLMVGFPERTVREEMHELIDAGVGNFILFTRNVGSREEISALTESLQSASGGEALIAIDHEGGRVMRLAEAATPWPSPMAWAATDDLELARKASRVAAGELAALGINLNFAPVADVLGDYRNPVLSTRCFSDDPRIVADFVTAFVRGHREGGVASTAKHFPGHGYTPVDSHVDLPRVDRDDAELRAADLVPFVAAMKAGVDCIMVSHVWYPSLNEEPTPASTSAPVMRLARDELGYDGVIVTDCLEMGAVQRRMTTGEAVVRAIASGADLAMVSHRADRQREAIEALKSAARDGDIPVERLEFRPFAAGCVACPSSTR
jgi:beta-N-acetylhexosaminidase